jgi:hypothetical protein
MNYYSPYHSKINLQKCISLMCSEWPIGSESFFFFLGIDTRRAI